MKRLHITITLVALCALLLGVTSLWPASKVWIRVRSNPIVSTDCSCLEVAPTYRGVQPRDSSVRWN